MIQSFIESCNMHGFLGQKSRIPDHAALTTEFTVSHIKRLNSSNENSRDKNCSEIKQPRYKTNKIPDDFITSNMSRQTLINVIEKIESCRETQRHRLYM